MLIGLRFVVQTFNVEYKAIAEQLGVSPATIQDWLKGRRNIPERRLVQLSTIFGVSKELFQKELSRSEQLQVQQSYIRKLSREHEMDVEDISVDDDGNEIRYTTSIDPFSGDLKEVKQERILAWTEEQFAVLLRSEDTLVNEFVKRVVPFVKQGQRKRIQLVSDILIYFECMDDEFNDIPSDIRNRNKFLFAVLDEMSVE